MKTETKNESPTPNPVQTVFKSIIVPIDFSDTSLQALDYAIALAREFGSRIQFLHVLEFPAVFNSDKPAYAAWDKAAKEASAQRLSELIREKTEGIASVTSDVRFGRAYQTVCERALQEKADLIVIGTHGFSGLKHVMLGSTAERVIRHAPCSVLTVRTKHVGDAKSFIRPKKILVPTDFSNPADEALQSAVVLAKQYDAELELLYVVPVHYAIAEYDQIDYTLLEVDQTKTGEEKLSELGKELLAQNISVKTNVRRGRAATEITQAATDTGADVILIATHGLTGWQHAVLGSTTEEVVRNSPCPVLVVRKKKTE